MKKQCLSCRKDFEPKNYWQKYCSTTCKQAAWAIRKINQQNKNVKFIKFNYGEDFIKYLDNYIPRKNDIYEVKVSFYRKPLERLSEIIKERIKQGEIFPANTKPDLDNSVKPILNSFNGKIWKDDCKISKLTIEQFFAKEEKTEIEIRILL